MTYTGDWIESSPGVNKNATIALSDTGNISVTLETRTSVTGGSSSQVCITPPDTRPSLTTPKYIRVWWLSRHAGLQPGQWWWDGVSQCHGGGRGRNLVPVTTKSGVPVQNEFVCCDEREVSPQRLLEPVLLLPQGPLQPSHMPPDLQLGRLELQGKSPQLSAPPGPLIRLLHLLVFPPQLCPPLSIKALSCQPRLSGSNNLQNWRDQIFDNQKF